VDSTFYFFLKNADLKAILEELPNPMENVQYTLPEPTEADTNA
jgi:hypothetical protein